MHATTTTRRITLSLLATTGLATAGLLAMPRAAFAEDAPGWPVSAFKQKSEADALKALYGQPIAASDKITLEVPDIAENGAVVPVAVSTTLPNVTRISLMVPENPFTLAASYVLPAGTEPSVACRLKMAKTSDVVAVVESDGKIFGARKTVKVTLGGCGG
jgi:sulfur-oxidizing protein SoxY